MSLRSIAFRSVLVLASVASIAGSVFSQGVKRVVLVKVDGLPGYYVDRYVNQRDPETGKSMLPWFEEVFYKNGTRLANFYTRGMSLSGPSWGQLDTGQHLQIKGNVEYDRFTLHPYDYLNFFPYYRDYGLSKRVDMPAVEVMDQLKIPLLSDAFPFEKKYTSPQLYQRGNDWALIAGGFLKLYPGDPGDFIDEWSMGLNFRGILSDQGLRNITGKLAKRPEIDYFDYYDTSFDHISHHNNDDASRLVVLKEMDRVIGKIWLAIQSSPRGEETALILLSDHGFNAKEKVNSQGFNLVKLLTSAEGGGHHVVTKRRLMLNYSVKGLYPLTPLIRTVAAESYYLKGQSQQYPTALLDFDGNERSSIHLRNNDLNMLHILLQQLQSNKLSPELRAAATEAIFKIIGEHSATWRTAADEMDEELDALHRWIEAQQKIIPTLVMKTSKMLPDRGLTEKNRRIAAQTAIAITAESDYRKYLISLRKLLSLKRETFNPHYIKIEDLIAPGAMGDANDIYQLQNYVVGLSAVGLSLDSSRQLDLDKSFTRVNYFELLHSQKVINNVQREVANRPIDFVAIRVPLDAVSASLPDGTNVNEDPIWLVGENEKQALILSRGDADGEQSYRYLPVGGLRQDAFGTVTFQIKDWADGFPLKFFEDKNLAVSDRKAWLSNWHSEIEWMRTTHKTTYSNAIIGLNDQVDRHPLSNDDSTLSADEKLISRFRQRQRRLTEADMLILANNHWNFDVRGFNPGGNHGSLFRVSTNSTLMFAGGEKTGIPRGLTVEEPYDGMSFAPTLLRLMGKIDDENRPKSELKELGFRKFPGRVVREVTGK
ncbi:MAG: alkaline phosphatase family protein [Chloracidobacterium sp.]|nr:alkaline phosphatase family protein [Chloracidobacterium sp.]